MLASIHQKGGDCKSIFLLLVLVIDDNAFCGLIMCSEHFRYLMYRHETIRCPSERLEDGVSLRFFSVDLSPRKAVLLRGGPLQKG